jgi:cytochrome c oxidase cbb3-type subunit 2
MPEEITSVILGSPESFKAEHNEGEPRYIYVKPITRDPAVSNLMIATKSGAQAWHFWPLSFIPSGSLYSVALVAYPSLLTLTLSSTDRARKAGLIYAIVGWFGSAMGIGMGQHLGQVPVLFVLLASALVLGPRLVGLLRLRGREVATTVTVLVAAFSVHRAILASRPKQPVLTQVERGRQVYISEGCINCHSQYVRPNTSDVLIWGHVQTIDELRLERPPLIGNRRQGPDLSEVGSRRSPLWLKAHLYNPQDVSHASFMPSYAYLFKNQGNRGDDLVAYLGRLGEATVTGAYADLYGAS